MTGTRRGSGKDVHNVNVDDLAARISDRFRKTPPDDDVPPEAGTPDTTGSHEPATPGTPASPEPPTLDVQPSHTPHPAPAPAEVAAKARGGRAPAREHGPDDNVRRSLYTRASAFAAIDDAAGRISAATGGLVPKHEAIDRIIQAGVAQTDTVIKALTSELTARLSPPA